MAHYGMERSVRDDREEEKEMIDLIGLLGVLIFTVYVTQEEEWWTKLKTVIGKAKRRSLRRDKSGLIWVWAVAMLAITVFAIVYFALGMAALMFIDAAEEAYTFEGSAQQTILLYRNVFAYVGIIFLVGVLIWALTNSRKKEYLSVET